MRRQSEPQIISNAVGSIARRALLIDWFSSVGKPAPPRDDVRWTKDWSETMRLLISKEWDDYLLDAMNDMTGPLPRPQIDDLGWVYEETNRILKPVIPNIIRSRVPAHGEAAEKAVQIVFAAILRPACIEAHFAQFVKKPFFGELFQWLEAGRLPCGAAGEYPARPLMIF